MRRSLLLASLLALASLPTHAQANSALGGLGMGGMAEFFLGVVITTGVTSVGALVTGIHNGLGARGEGPPISTAWAVTGYTFGGLALAAGVFNFVLAGGKDPLFITMGAAGVVTGVASIAASILGQLRSQPVGAASGAASAAGRRGSFFSLPTLRF